MNLLEQFIKARKVSTPIIAIECYDQEATMAQIQNEVITKNNSTAPIIQWDMVRGVKGRNNLGKAAIENPAMYGQDTSASINTEQFLEKVAILPKSSLLFIMNAHRLIAKNSDKSGVEINQAIWNLRDLFKSDYRTLVLLGPKFELPDELIHDITLFVEPLPNSDQLREIVKSTIGNNNIEFDLTDELLDKTVNALRGIPTFPAEQAVALSTSKSGINIDSVWERKYQMINSTPGLKIYRGNETFENIGGCEAVKTQLTRIMKGREAPRVIVFIDEGEKMFAGATHETGDNTGVSQDILATTLTFMEDNEVEGTIFVGHPGTAKSAIAKSMANEFQVPVITLDFGAIKSSGVGDSERSIREAYKMINSIGDGRAFFILTSNEAISLPSALKRRFTAGTFFFDLPTNMEMLNIISIYSKKYFPDTMINSKGICDRFVNWTGAEIRNAFRMAYRQNISLEEAAEYIIPISKSDSSGIAKLRKMAHNTFLSANKKGAYEYRPEADQLAKGRQIEL